MNKFIGISFLILFLWLIRCSAVLADLPERRHELQQIREQIEQTQKYLEQKQASEKSFSRKLARLKRTLQRLDQQVGKLKSEYKQLLSQIQDQQNQLAMSQRKLRQGGKRLEKRLVSLYKDGEVGPLKVLFSANSPTELVQQYQYLTRVMENDQQLLAEYRTDIDAHQQLLATLDRLKQQKAALLKEQEAQRRLAVDGRRVQVRLLKKARSEKKQLKQELVQLQDRKNRLQGLIKRLKQQSEPHEIPSGTADFAAGKGRLNWPIEGDVQIAFGTQKDQSLGTYYESNGIEIFAARGASIRAVADGKVVFANWFKGYGNLMILSHPGGFHTLYAQLERFEKDLGDTIKAGTVIGTSGLEGRDSIYFEVRKKGTAVNPLNWLKKR